MISDPAKIMEQLASADAMCSLEQKMLSSRLDSSAIGSRIVLACSMASKSISTIHRDLGSSTCRRVSHNACVELSTRGLGHASPSCQTVSLTKHALNG
jgi:hypothetical protein